jgi:hypothetical protein
VPIWQAEDLSRPVRLLIEVIGSSVGLVLGALGLLGPRPSNADPLLWFVLVLAVTIASLIVFVRAVLELLHGPRDEA